VCNILLVFLSLTNCLVLQSLLCMCVLVFAFSFLSNVYLLSLRHRGLDSLLLAVPVSYFCVLYTSCFKVHPRSHLPTYHTVGVVDVINVSLLLLLWSELCTVDCGTHGRCSSQRCVCDEGWSGTTCDQRDCDRRCTASSHGHCNNGTCVCQPGWNGRHCTLGSLFNVVIRLRSDYDVSRTPASVRRDSTRAKNEHVNFSSYSRIVVVSQSNHNCDIGLRVVIIMITETCVMP